MKQTECYRNGNPVCCPSFRFPSYEAIILKVRKLTNAPINDTTLTFQNIDGNYPEVGNLLRLPNGNNSNHGMF